MAEQQQQHRYEFGPFCLDTNERVLLREGRPLQLKPKVYETLLALISRSGHVVDKEELMRQVWPDVVVEENNLTGNIYALRRAFAEYQYIETVPRRGYRFTADVKLVKIEDVKLTDRSGAETEVVIKQTLSTERRPIDSLAVLPFINMSADPENEYFCDGLAEELLNALANIDALKVAARTSSFSFKGKNVNVDQIGRALNVRSVLEGSVRKAGNRVRITVQLINAADGYHLWSERYDREMKDIFDVQDEITLAVVTALKLKLLGEAKDALKSHGTKDPAAYQAYLKGRTLLYQRGLSISKAIDCFKQAVSLDSEYAEAWAGLADGYTTSGFSGFKPAKEVMPRALEAARRALQLDPDLAEAHSAMACATMLYDLDYDLAEQEFKRALELNPNYTQARAWYGLFLLQWIATRDQEARHELLRMLEIDPLSGYANVVFCLSCITSGRPAEAVKHGQKGVELDPNSYVAHCSLAAALASNAQYEDAATMAERALSVSGRHDWALAFLASIYASWDKPEKARAVYRELEARSAREYIQASMLAEAAGAAGDMDRAIGFAQQALDEKDPLFVVFARTWPGYDRLRTDSRFVEIASRLAPSHSKDFAPTPNEARAKPIDSLAVLPFVNASGDPATEYLSDGITESVINRLSQLSGLKLIARNTVFRYKGRETDATDLKRDLGVRAALLGRVLQFGEHLIIRTELVDTADGRQLWGEQYNRKPSDILAVQEEIAREISEKLRLRLTGEERRRLTKRYTENGEAYREYLKGRYFWNKRTGEGVKKAIEYFQQAIEKDPTYALAYVGLADSFASLAYYLINPLPPREVMPKAKAAAMKGLEIDENLAEGHASLGAIKMYYDWDWAGAESEFQHALQLNPGYALAHYWYGVYLTAMERFEEGFAELKWAQELDPLSPIINTGVGTSLYYQRRYDQSVEEYHKVLETYPNFAPAHLHLGLAYVQKGMLPQAIVELEQALALSSRNSMMMASLAHAYAVSGKRGKARTLLHALTDEAKRNHISSLDVAVVYAVMGAKDQAFEWLEKAYAEKSGWLILIRVEPRLGPLRSDSRFADLLERIGLGDESSPPERVDQDWRHGSRFN